MIARDLEVNLHNAFVAARKERHELITVEHLLLALLDNASACQRLRERGADIDKLRKALHRYIAQTSETVPEGREVDTQPTIGFQRVIQQAILHAQANGNKEVTGPDVLVAISRDRDSAALLLLAEQGIDHRNVMKAEIDDAVSNASSEDEQPAAIDDERTRQIILLHDAQTPAQFAVSVLEAFLLVDAQDAAEIVGEAERYGKAVCGLFPRETAEFVLQQVAAHCRKHGHRIRLVAAVQTQ